MEYDLSYSKEGHLWGTFQKKGYDILEVENRNDILIVWMMHVGLVSWNNM